MIFPRSKKVVFYNNKGGVGKTTLAFNCAAEFAHLGYKTVLIDLDPQCNLTLQTLGQGFFEPNLLSEKTIWDVLKGITEGGKDIDTSIELLETPQVNNLYIIPGSLKLSYFESLLSDSAFNQASSGQSIGYFTTSAIDRFLTAIGIKHDVDIFVIDTGPSLGALNRAILLGTDYFITPVMADAFSVQGIENIGEQLSRWIEHWRLTAEAVARSPERNISADQVLKANPLFLGYVINNFNVYAKKTIQRQDEWRGKLPKKVYEYLSIRHSRNGLIERSSKEPLGSLQDYGQLTPISMDLCKPIQDISPTDDSKLNLQGTRELAEKAKSEIKQLANTILEIINKY